MDTNEPETLHSLRGRIEALERGIEVTDYAPITQPAYIRVVRRLFSSSPCEGA
jgi:hypothetical protein